MFEPLNDLERLLMEATKDASKRPAFQELLLKSKLFGASAGLGEDGRPVSMRAVALKNGSVGAALFSAGERVATAFGREVTIISDTGHGLLNWLKPGPIVLNPGLEYGLVWDKAELETLLASLPEPPAAEKAAGFQLGFPPKRPHELIGLLSNALGSDPTVTEAYLMWCTRDDRPQANWLLGVASERPWNEVQELVNRSLRIFDLGPNPLDAVPLTPGPLADSLRRGIAIVVRPPPAPPKKRGLFGFKKG